MTRWEEMVQNPPGEPGDGVSGEEALGKSSCRAARFRLRHRESLPSAFRIKLWSTCLMVVKAAHRFATPG